MTKPKRQEWDVSAALLNASEQAAQAMPLMIEAMTCVRTDISRQRIEAAMDLLEGARDWLATARDELL